MSKARKEKEKEKLEEKEKQEKREKEQRRTERKKSVCCCEFKPLQCSLLTQRSRGVEEWQFLQTAKQTKQHKNKNPLKALLSFGQGTVFSLHNCTMHALCFAPTHPHTPLAPLRGFHTSFILPFAFLFCDNPLQSECMV
jgi:hypothetical protein